MVLNAAQKAINLLGYAGEKLMKEPDTVKKMFELQLEEKSKKQILNYSTILIYST